MVSVALGTETVKSYLEGTVSTDRHGMKRNRIKLHSFHFTRILLLMTRKIIQKHSNKLSSQIKLNSRKLMLPCNFIFVPNNSVLTFTLSLNLIIYLFYMNSLMWALNPETCKNMYTLLCLRLIWIYYSMTHPQKCLLSATWSKRFLPNLFTASEIPFDHFCQRSKLYLQRSCTSILPKACRASLWNHGSAGPHPG